MFNFTTQTDEFLFCFSQTLKELDHTTESIPNRDFNHDDNILIHHDINPKDSLSTTPTNH